MNILSTDTSVNQSKREKRIISSDREIEKSNILFLPIKAKRIRRRCKRKKKKKRRKILPNLQMNIGLVKWTQESFSFFLFFSFYLVIGLTFVSNAKIWKFRATAAINGMSSD